jgi:triacylglycerol esterase/lipase EstA (alpha/beta hydrolase family)
MPLDDDIYIEYKTESDLVETVKKIKSRIEKRVEDNTKIDLIGHSLGGVMCVILFHLGLKNIRSITTMSAPFGGITNHSLLRFWFPKSIYSEFHKLEREYSYLLTKPITVPYQFYVSTKGSNPLFLGKQNDGVVSVLSQKAIPNVKYIDVSTNHYEILMNEGVVNNIRTFLTDLK